MVKNCKNKSNQKKFEGDLKIKLCSKRLYPTESVTYLAVKIDTKLSWQYYGHDLSIKLSRPSNALLSKMRKYVSLKILRWIYFAIFDSYLSYCWLIWAQDCSLIQQIVILQKKAVRINNNFQSRKSHTSPLIRENSILKFQDKSCLENIVSIYIIYHRKYLMLGLVFPQINIMKPQVLHKVTSKNVFIVQIDMESIQ